MTTRERRLARAERLREWAEKRELRAAAVFREGERYHGDVAFNTQSGHIPERARLIRREDAAFASLGKARGMASRATELERQADASVYDDDPDAIEQFQVRIAEREAEVAQAKRVNAAWRKGGLDGLRALGCADHAIETVETTMRLCPWLTRPMDTTNLRAAIRRDKERIARLEREATEGPPWRYFAAAKYGGACCVCGEPVKVGDPILYRRPEVKHYAGCIPAARDGETP